MSTNSLALGTVQFGLDYGVANKTGKVHCGEVEKILSGAKKNGIDIIDTAIAYGTSEEVMGGFGLDGFRVVTKLPSLPADQGNIARWVRDQVEASLKRLGQKKLYGLLLHRPSDLMGKEAELLIGTLINLKQMGLIQKLGISIYSPDELDAVCKRIKIDLVQAPLNVIDRRLQSCGWLDRLKDDGVEIHTRSTFLQGLLLMERNKIPQKFSRWSNLWDQWYEKLTISKVSPLSACLTYPLSLKQIDRVIVGVDSALQLSEILHATKVNENMFDTEFMCSEDIDLINPSNWVNL